MKPGESAGIWLFKTVAGLLIIGTLFIHFIVNHALVPGGLLSYQDVINYYANPWIVTMEVFFLIFVVTHILLGIRSIILDLRPTVALMRMLDLTFIVLGLCAIIYGIWLAATIAARAV